MLFVGYAAFRGRQYRLAMTARTAKHGTRLSGLGT
jgi:hypothetical protein